MSEPIKPVPYWAKILNSSFSGRIGGPIDWKTILKERRKNNG